jgi:hypothetical protein
MAAAIVLLSGRVSKTGPFSALSVLAGSPHSATDGFAIARDSGRNPGTTIPEHFASDRPQVGAIPFLQLRNVLIVRDFVLSQARL